MTRDDLFQIFRRYHAGQSLSSIALLEKRQRKTIRYYLKKLKGAGFCKGIPFPQKEELYIAIDKILASAVRRNLAISELEECQKEIEGLINHPDDPVVPKIAFEIVKERRSLTSSYSSFKRFIRVKGLFQKQNSITRIELPPGEECQIDYGHMGLLFDKKLGQCCRIYSFIATLSHSRHKFIQFVKRQTKESFVGSIIDFLEYLGGVVKRMLIDNLKAGVIKPDLYDPKINRALQEMAEYYGIFVDPCRVGKATDKGKVERAVPVARQLFRKLKHLYPEASLEELNKYAKDWCINEYGMKEHGTTNEKPYEVFIQREKITLMSLPAERFKIAQWKKLTIHPDRFVQLNKKRYGIPESVYKGGMELWGKQVDNRVYIYDLNYHLLREYVVPQQKSYAYYPGDFPEIKREMMEGKYPQYLLKKAQNLGEKAYELIEQVLTPHAYLNSRRAQGFLEIMEKYRCCEYFETVCQKALKEKIHLPRLFHQLMKQEESQLKLEFEGISISSLGQEMIRDIDYYVK